MSAPHLSGMLSKDRRALIPEKIWWLGRKRRRWTVRHLVYAMRFVGRATPTGEVGGVWRTTTTAPSAALHAIVSSEGLQVSREFLLGGVASCGSEVVFTGDATFQEIGEIHFDDAHRLRFTTVGSGYLGPCADPALQLGAVIWRVEEGKGQFAGASGMIGATILLRDDGQLVVHHLGPLFMPDPLTS
jgi:hypothetical protein